ncbi:MAG: hypothetical protein ACOH5I_07140 [Oligoflexus sp.]
MKWMALCLFAGLPGCVSEGAYFELDDLRRMVRDRHPAQDIVHRFGTPKVQYSDDIFYAPVPVDKNTPQLVVHTVDEAVFHVVDEDDPAREAYEEKNPYAKVHFAESDQEDKQVDPTEVLALRPHLSDTYSIVDCEGQARSIKYHAKRSDPNGYVETQYTMLLLDQHWRVCGFKSRSHFAGH